MRPSLRDRDAQLDLPFSTLPACPHFALVRGGRSRRSLLFLSAFYTHRAHRLSFTSPMFGPRRTLIHEGMCARDQMVSLHGEAKKCDAYRIVVALHGPSGCRGLCRVTAVVFQCGSPGMAGRWPLPGVRRGVGNYRSRDNMIYWIDVFRYSSGLSWKSGVEDVWRCRSCVLMA